MKKLISFLVLGVISLSNVYAQDAMCNNYAVEINGFSKHFKKVTNYAKTYGYNEKNYGLGFSCNLSEDESEKKLVTIGFLENSYRERSTYVKYSYLNKFEKAPDFYWGFTGIAANGYDMLDSSHNGWMLGVAASTRYDITKDISLDFVLAPSMKKFSGFAFVSLSLKLPN